MTAPSKKEAKLSPSYVSLDLTYKCQLNCGFCFIHNNGVQHSSGRELSPAALTALVERLSGAKRCFYLAGGEPSLNPSLVKLVALIKKRGHRCHLTTNAQGLDAAAADALVNAGLDEFEISIHGPPDLHDRITGRKGAFAAAEKLCRRVLARPRGSRPGVSLWCTVSRLNQARLYETYRVLAALKPEIVAFNHLSFVTRADIAQARKLFKEHLGAALKLKDTSALARGLDAEVIISEMRRIRAEGNPALRFDPDLSDAEIRAWYDPRAKIKPRGFCLAQWSDMWVRPDGQVVPCQPLNYLLGDAGKKDPLEIYNGPAYARFRALMVKAGGFLPTCSRCGRSSFSSSRGSPGGWLAAGKKVSRRSGGAA